MLAGSTASAQVSDGVVKIGVMNDQSRLYEDVTGMKALEAAKMAVEDDAAPEMTGHGPTLM